MKLARPCCHPMKRRHRAPFVDNGERFILEWCLDCGVVRTVREYLGGEARGPFCKFLKPAAPAAE